jgi:hypothetical protein
LLDGVLTTTGVGEGAGVAMTAAAAGAAIASPALGMTEQPDRAKASARTITPIHTFVIFVFIIM